MPPQKPYYRPIPTTNDLPKALYRAQQVRAMDRCAIEQFGIPGYTLMQRAGVAAFTALRRRWPQAHKLLVLCGVGNNGGDGYVLARLAHRSGMAVEVLQMGDRARLKGEALEAAQALQACGCGWQAVGAGPLPSADVVVDALLGTGLERDLQGAWRQLAEQVNQSGKPVMALDIPTGLHADTGKVLGAAITAELTISFIGLKQGLFTGQGPDYCGDLRFDALAVPAAVYGGQILAARRMEWSQWADLCAPRLRSAHKGACGHVLVLGGAPGYSGAARMAAEAAARVGAGLVSVATSADHAVQLTQHRPELMCHGVCQAEDLAALFARANVLAIGPGLGRSCWSEMLWQEALAESKAHSKPLVVDADALHLLAQSQPGPYSNWILTPHPGEAAKLLQTDIPAIQADRFQAVRSLQARYGGCVVLKGAGTLVAGDPQRPIGVCSAGNPGMAGGGMGDVLTGVIAGLLAQGWDFSTAAEAGVCLHAAAGDRAAQEGGERGLLAADLFLPLRYCLNAP